MQTNLFDTNIDLRDEIPEQRDHPLVMIVDDTAFNVEIL